MGNYLTNCKSCFKSSEENPPTEQRFKEKTLPEDNPPREQKSKENPLPDQELQECIGLFKEIKDIDELINMTQQLLQRIKSNQQNNPENASTSSQLTHVREEESNMWTSITNKGSQMLEWLNKFGSSEELHRGIKVVAETLQQVGQTNSVLAGLSTIAFVLSKYEKMRDNQPECLQALEDLIELAQHLRSFKNMIPQEEENFMKAFQLIVEDSITCLCQLDDNTLFRFFKSSVNSEYLTNLRRRINELYPKLGLSYMEDIRKDTPTYLPPTKPVYPEYAVGIEERVDGVLDILTTTTGQLSLAVIIYGFGGLGKTTVAKAVVSKMNLTNYNYIFLELYQEEVKNNFTGLQERILKDCFPQYNGGKPIKLTQSIEGRDNLMQAFKYNKEKVKPVFLVIDNALRSQDLKELLPQDLGDLPQGSRILVTTRHLGVTDMFEGQPNLERRDWPLHILPDEDAKKILFKDQTKAETIKSEDLNRILKVCSGVPLALNIVGAQLHKQSYRVDRCAKILEILEKGDKVKEEKLSERLFDFVYDELEEYIQEALLDICFFFSKWNREDVEYIVGATAVTSLLEAGLITSTSEDNDPNVSPHNEELIVHDIIRAKGQGLAKGNRILDVQSLCEAAAEQRLDQIKGVWLVNEESKYVLEETDLNRMRKSLRVLVLGERVRVSRVSQMRFEELKFLQVSGDIPQLPVKLEGLDKLTVFHGPFFTEGEVSLRKLPKSLLSMKVIPQSHSTECTNSQITGAPPCPSLQKLDFSELVEPPQLPEGFNQLVALSILILEDNEMQELPEQICQLPALKVLTMNMCWELKCLAESFGQLTALRDLDLSRCEKLEALPDTFGQLTALRDLNLFGCKKLEALPDTFGQLTALRDLDLSRVPRGRVPPLGERVSPSPRPRGQGYAKGDVSSPSPFWGMSPRRPRGRFPVFAAVPQKGDIRGTASRPQGHFDRPRGRSAVSLF